MNEEEIRSRIRICENKLHTLRESIKKLERDYEELSALFKEHQSMEEKFLDRQASRKANLSHCAQRQSINHTFAGYVYSMNGLINGYEAERVLNGLGSAKEKIVKRREKTLRQLNEEENQQQMLQRECDELYRQLNQALAEKDAMGGKV